MTKPLDHVREPQQSDRKLSVADWREIFRTVKELVNISVAAPLTKSVSAGAILLALAGTLLPPGKKGEILYHDGEHWVVLPVPTWDAVLYFDFDTTELPMWVETTDYCPSTTTGAPTTTTA